MVSRDTLLGAVKSWEEVWDVPTLADRVSIVFSRRLRVSLGRCIPASGRIVLHDTLRHGPSQRLVEVLCHEAAHIAVFIRHGGNARPHGPEWAELVRVAGYGPDVRASQSSPRYDRTRSATGRYTVVHTCPVCQTRRFARRRVSAWRCAECVAAGLSGELVVTRQRPPSVSAE